MHLIGLTNLLQRDALFTTQVQNMRNNTRNDWNIIRSARPFVLATLAHVWDAPIIYLTTTGRQAYNSAEQLPVWLANPARIFRFDEPTPMFYDRLPWDKSVIQDRIDTLQALLFAEYTPADQQPIVVASARALMQRTMPVHRFRKHSQIIQVSQQHEPEVLMKSWLELGYDPVTMVVQPGTFSRRGGLLDIFPTSSDLPVRIEFGFDGVETLRTFNPSTQRTVAKVDDIRIVPAREALPESMPQLATHLEAWFKDHQSDEVTSFINDYEAMQQGNLFPHLEHYLPYVYANPVSVLDYAPDDALIVVDDIGDLENAITVLAEEAETNRDNNIKTGQLPDDFPVPYVAWETIVSDLERATTINFANNAEGKRIFTPNDRFGGQLRPAMRHVRQLREDAQRVVIVSQQVERMANIYQEQDATGYVPKMNELPQAPDIGEMVFVQGELSNGFTMSLGDDTLTLLTDSEIFGWQRPEPRRRKTSKGAVKKLPESDYSDWHAGDFVVHVDYGIGRFQGLRTRTVEGNEREYLLVEYASNGMLFVPIHQSDRLTRYVGADDVPPKMNTIGKQDVWTRTKEKARKNAVKEAKELLAIYAKRAKASGHAYAPDTAWQRELEAAFPYVETEDQLRVIREVKKDMETPMPMDRLVCGDVGYGKTEVALRAAFKAVNDGKQVAVLVPTTVLANQHFNTFRNRMTEFPVRVEMLSRFRTKGEISRATTDIAAGKVDIVIGTHRILSDDVTFNDLGLVIIDEEQRFGVKHKSHFKKLRASVDVITLTATPIPRTLYMSMSGVRDISMLQTPPEDRLPVITHVGSFDAKLVRQAVLRELDRGGQAFVIHNRVKSIYQLKEKLEEILPEASVVVGHGQMSGKQLEAVIRDFSKGQYDILLATSIIESGIDMPNVNTLIVDRADWFGMAQLYQIRGRVGRSATQAYAYFFHAGTKKLTEEARERLETLAEYTELGSGFQVSVRDLELRGAGDILSTKQTGHVATVGLQLYTQLLQQAVRELKGDAGLLDTADTDTKQSHESERIIIDLPLPTYIPEDWIPEMALRLQLYRRIASLQTVDDIANMEAELRDRFGILPPAVEGLLYQIRIKLMAADINATAVQKPRQEILIKLPWLQSVNRTALAYELGDDIEVSRTAVELRFDEAQWQDRLMDILKQLKAGLPEQVGV
ncbi:MAG: transcription-repair coupling factor [Chloroflexota bacterium]